MTINDFIRQCKKSGEFSDRQMKQILWGFERDLTMEQIKIFAKPVFNNCQMYELCKGFEDGLTIKQVEVYANPEFSAGQMKQIRYGFEDGLSIKQAKFYANPEFNSKQMLKICEFIKENDITDMSINTIRFLLGLNCI